MIKMIKLSQKVQLRASVGWNAGLAVGMAGVLVVLSFSPMKLGMRIFTSIGLLCAIGATIFQLITSIEMLKNYNAALKMFEKKEPFGINFPNQSKDKIIQPDKIPEQQEESLAKEEN